MLKSLEIQGFKSFPDPTTLVFHNGVTAVVGPNGAGKSNIADAIRWVLGEQSAKTLRGGRMEDVVFNGTAQRRQVSFAEVTLTIDNSAKILPVDYETVAITRRYFRSGESVYMINKTPCRLRDISNLLMDTGIGMEGYSIVGQGRVNEILSGNPEDRRALFEEASGIVLYRWRKTESLRRLERSDQNLLRVDDLLTELHERERPLKKQADDARHHLELVSRYRSLDATLTLKQLEKLELDRAKGEDDGTTIRLDFEKACEDLENTRRAHSRSAERTAELDEALEHTRDSVSELSVDETRRTGKDALLREKLEASKKTSQLLLEEKNRLTVRLLAYDQEDTQRRQRQEELLNKRMLLETECRNAQTGFEAVDAEFTENGRRIAEAVRERESITEQIASQRALLQEKRGECQALAERQQRLRDEERSYGNDRETQQKALDLQSDAISALRQRIEADEALADQARAKTEERRRATAQIDRSIADIRQNIQKLTYEADTLEHLEASYEGYNRPVKNVMDQVRKEKAQHAVPGPLGSLLFVPEDLSLAIETALGASANHIVCDTRETAEYWINHLREMRGGRATFLPLSALVSRPPGRDILEKASHAHGFVGLASDLVGCPKDIEPALQMALGKTLVVETIKDATRLSDKINRACRIVSLLGDLVHPSGSMTGGFMPTKPQGLLGRPEKIREKRNQAAALREEQLKTEAGLDRARNLLSDAARKEEALLQKLADERRDLIRRSADRDAAEESLRILDQFLKSRTEEARSTGARMLELNREAAAIESSLAAASQTRGQLIADIASKSGDNQEKAKLRDEKRDALVKLSASLDVLTEQMAAFDASTRQAESEKSEASIRLRSIERELVSQKETLDRIRSELEDNLNALEKTKGLRAEKEEAYASLMTERAREVEQQQVLFRSLETSNERVTTLYAARERHAADMSRLAAQCDDLLNRLWETHGLTRTDAEQYLLPIESIRQASSERASLKQKIDALGPINQNAVTEYEELSSRIRFMETQRDDIEKTKEELRQVIDGLEQSMREQFAKTFHEVNQQFSQVFSDLFSGGQAELVLEGSDDILEADIGIRAQPPGKKLQRLSLLSGGERCLTAIALIFAILKLKPTPFCLFDEVESALDDANVDRFGDYVRKYAWKMQFILITHRKGTMAASDRLYGVTMQERGISRILSMKLSSALSYGD